MNSPEHRHRRSSNPRRWPSYPHCPNCPRCPSRTRCTTACPQGFQHQCKTTQKRRARAVRVERSATVLQIPGAIPRLTRETSIMTTSIRRCIPSMTRANILEKHIVQREIHLTRREPTDPNAKALTVHQQRSDPEVLSALSILKDSTPKQRIVERRFTAVSLLMNSLPFTTET